jgi:formamidopyrimidine-DNA glycosylase
VPELPDIVAYLKALETRVVGETLRKIRLSSPFLLRTVDPPPAELEGRQVTGLSRIGKRLVFHLEGDLFAVLHLMIAGRLHWKAPGTKPAGKIGLAAFDFDGGTLTLTEASSKKRASLHLVRGAAGLAEFDRGGVEPVDASLDAFREPLLRENHTLKRSLTDPRLFSGIGNAFSDEILHRAQLSPVKWTTRLTEEEIARLYGATREVLLEWIGRLESQAGDKFPEKVTAFRPEMAVHGKFNQPCPVCGTHVARIVYAENEANYCPTCQTGGKLLADRSLSRLLKDDWPRTQQELEEKMNAQRGE